MMGAPPGLLLVNAARRAEMLCNLFSMFSQRFSLILRKEERGSRLSLKKVNGGQVVSNDENLVASSNSLIKRHFLAAKLASTVFKSLI